MYKYIYFEDEKLTNNYLFNINYLFNQNKILSEDEKRSIVQEICFLTEMYCDEIIHLENQLKDLKNIDNRKAPQRKGAIIGKKPKMFNDDDIKEMARLKNKGFSNVKISKIFKCSEKTIRNYLKSF